MANIKASRIQPKPRENNVCLSIEVNRPECVLSKGEFKGFEFVTVHNDIGYRCGYVRVPKGHAWHGKDWGEVDCDIHGGVTFAEADMQCDKEGDDDAWWIGFDCAHSGDAPDPTLPSKSAAGHYPCRGVIRSLAFVEMECRRLCEQAAVA